MTARAQQTAILLSPHLDDVAFSCGGVAAALAGAGWRVIIATAFTRSVHPATGFALACQRDKNLPDTVDYLALRRDEDKRACLALGCEQRLFDLPEAPNRGYHSVAALFGRPRSDDDVTAEVANHLYALVDEAKPALVLAPQGCGGHVDHLCVIKAVMDIQAKGRLDDTALGFYRDTPYVIRDDKALPDQRVADFARDEFIKRFNEQTLAVKLQAVAAYDTQLNFQFGGKAQALVAIAALAQREAGGQGHAERLSTRTPETLSGLLR